MSASTKLAIITRALALAGRNMELKEITTQLLDDLLRDWAQSKKFPQLNKTGATVFLGAGATTVPLPTDYGAGMDNLLFSDDKIPLEEFDADDFVHRRGFPRILDGNGRPTLYTVDEESGIFRFNRTSDKVYQVIPIYFKIPPNVGDAETVWYKNDRVLIKSLVGEIMEFTGDERELVQQQKALALKANFERGDLSKTGGSKTITLSRQVFRPRRRFL